MSDGIQVNAGLGPKVACDELTYSGETQQVQLNRLVHVSGVEGSKTLTEICDAFGLGVHPRPEATGGCSNFHLVAAATANATNVKASPGQVYGISVFSKTTYPVYVKFHNNAGAPAAGAGVIKTVGAQAGVRAREEYPCGLAFATGIAITIVKDLADGGTTVVAAEDCVVDIEYK